MTTDESTIPEGLRAFLTREIPRYEAQELADDDARHGGEGGGRR